MILVWAQDNVSGTLDRAADGFFFGYDSAAQQSAAVSLTMPVSLEGYDYLDLHPVFQMNLPEGRLRELIHLKFRKAIQGFDDFDLLRFVGNSQIGRLRYSNDAHLPVVPAQNLDEILKSKGTFELKNYLLETYLSSSGVSGAQPKVLVRDADAGTDIDRLTMRGATHIIKTFSETEFPELATNEHFCMRAAHHAGLPVPEIALSENGQFLVVKRFDIAKSGQYLGFEDFCALSGRGSHAKYDSSYELLAKHIQDFISPSERRAALDQFYTSLVLSCTVRNGDAHLKNFGALYADTLGTVRYAPTFDIVTTSAYIPMDTMALTLNGTKLFPMRSDLLAFGVKHCKMPVKFAEQTLERVADAVGTARKELSQHMRDAPRFAAVGRSMQAAWDLGISRLSDKTAVPVVFGKNPTEKPTLW
jgi:serine/threonine-protein kinase HipA